MSLSILDKINSPSDLRALSKTEIATLAGEIREFLIAEVGHRGGHLASNLGTVELSIALHRVFDSPSDHIIFDVGHQSYVHKILTGRKAEFSALRTPGGLSGFTARRESEHDPFGAGHSSTAISAALGFAEADFIKGSSAHTVCVVGDGAYTGGMVHEALNNCKQNLPLVIILNDNGMSISQNRGSFAEYLSRVRVSERYRACKRVANKLLDGIPLVGKPAKRFFGFTKNKIKRLVYKSNYFEDLGLYYMGPFDGNDYDKVERALTDAKNLGKTVLVHLKTKKGKGYTPAETSPDAYHNITNSDKCATFRTAVAEKLIELAGSDGKIVAVTAAMGIGTGLDAFGDKFPERYFDVGIAEEHALTFSAGLAAAGMSPYVAIYSTFLQRGYDSILHDIALQNLPVRMLIDRAGLATADGATHHGIFDVAFLSHIPSVRIFAPVTYKSLGACMEFARNCDGPVAIRYSNCPECETMKAGFAPLSVENPFILADFRPENSPGHIFVTYGAIAERVIEAKNMLASDGISTGIIILEALKPYADTASAIIPIISRAEKVLLVEEGIRNGGASQIILDELSRSGFDFNKTKIVISAIDDNFANPSEVCDLYDFVGLSPAALARKMKKDD